MIAASYLRNENYSEISDNDIEQVIDYDAPCILHEIRSKLKLSRDALIIPSDSHDYLIDKAILSQNMFGGVFGGNVLDEEHIGKFLDVFIGESEDQRYKKTAAAFFFHEHVVSITKMVTSDGKVPFFNFIDSMPYETNIGCTKEEDAALRIRCNSTDSLKITLRWYFLAKFSEEDKLYINRNAWSEKQCVTDPRVFQVFIWMNVLDEI